VRPAWISACISALCAAGGACDSSPKVIDPFPISIDLNKGAAIIPAREGGQESSVALILDVLSPISVVDSYRAGGTFADPRRRIVDLTLFGVDDFGVETVPRVRFSNVAVFDLHSCGETTPSPANCRVGLGDDTTEVFGVLGSDILFDNSLRIDFPTSDFKFFPDAAGSVSERTLACDAVFERPYSGGGTLIVGGGEVRFGSNRTTVGACLHHSPIEEPGPSDSEVGTDMQLAISTGHGPTILSESAYRRYAASAIAPVTIPALESLPSNTLHLLSGPLAVRMGEVSYAAFVGVAGEASNRRGPCRELYANARMRIALSCADDQVDCPCALSEDTCKAAAAVEVNRTIEVAVVEDTVPLLQGLRDELRPAVPELDGILGIDALRALRVEFDSPNNRLMMRCLDTEFCTTRPQVRSQSNLAALDECREAEDATRGPPPQDAGPLP
jgi:hypothetical protein